MVDLLKAFGRGILYVLAFPFFLIVLAIFAVVGFIAFIVQLVKSIIFFFTGQKFFPELPEDKQLRLMKEAEEAKNNPAPNQPEPTQTATETSLIFEEVKDDEPAPMITPIPTPAPTSVEEACFQDYKEEPAPAPTPTPEPVKEETPVEEIKVEEEQPEQPEVITPLGDLLKEEENEDPLDDLLSALEEEQEPVPEDLETYKPRGSEDSFQDEENEDTHVGVDIRYDD